MSVLGDVVMYTPPAETGPARSRRAVARSASSPLHTTASCVGPVRGEMASSSAPAADGVGAVALGDRDHHRFVHGERAHCGFVTLLALVLGGWLVLGVVVVAMLNVAKWLVRSASEPAPRVASSEGHWPAPYRSAPESTTLPQPYVPSAVVSRRSGVGSGPAG